MKRPVKVSLFATLCAVIVSVLCFSVATHAAKEDSGQQIADSYMGALTVQLYDRGGMETEITTIDHGRVSSSSFLDTALTPEGNSSIWDLPDGGFLQDVSSSDTASGADVLEWAGRQANGQDLRSISVTDTESADAAARSLGYEVLDDGYKITIPIRATTWADREANSDGSGVTQNYGSEGTVYKAGEQDMTVTIVRSNGQTYVTDNTNGLFSTDGDGNLVMKTKDNNWLDLDDLDIIGRIFGDDKSSVTIPITDSAEETLNAIRANASNQKLEYGSAVQFYGTNIYQYEIGNDISQEANHKYVLNKSGEEVVKGLLDTDDLSPTDDAQYAMYKYYFDQAVRGDALESANCLRSGSTAPSNMVAVKLKHDGKWVQYYFDRSSIDSLGALDTVSSDGTSINSVTIDGIIDWLNNGSGSDSHAVQEECEADYSGGATIAPASNSPDAVAPVESDIINSGAIDSETNDINCWNSAGGLGFWSCELLKYAQNTVKTIYREIATHFLEFRAEFLSINGEGQTVYSAWQVFQSFANILFVIVLLIVIFSQLTGVGIDNLGIKRVLPKLIIAAVLINLSYLICLLFVDLSNIVGSGANGIFANLTTNVSGSTSGSGALATVMETAVIGSVGFLAAGSVGIWGPVVVLPLLLGLISALIGVLFFFILLGARQAGIIILVVLSPVAFACYMLPNTKSIFNKWFKMFEGLLLLYPICGAVMGGSAFASAILMRVDTGFLGHLIAMLLGVIPFFFIPILLRGAFSAMGNLGARISGVGQGLGRRLTGAIGNSDAAKEAQLRARAGVDSQGNPTRLGRMRMNIANGDSVFSRVPGFRRMNQRASARGRGAYAKYLSDQMREENLNSPDFFRKYQRSQKIAADREQLSTAIDNVNDATNKGENESILFDMYDKAIKNGDAFTARAVVDIAGRRKDTADSFIKKFKNDSSEGKYAGRADMAMTIAKQISTGEGSKNYRAANALGFEYAAQMTKGQTTDDYGTWVSDEGHIHDAIDHHITNGAEMYGQSNSSLREIAALSEKYQVDKDYLAKLARRAEEEGRVNGTYDVTKEKSFETLKNLAPESAGSSESGSIRAVSDASTEGATLNIPRATESNSNELNAINEINQAMSRRASARQTAPSSTAGSSAATTPSNSSFSNVNIAPNIAPSSSTSASSSNAPSSSATVNSGSASRSSTNVSSSNTPNNSSNGTNIINEINQEMRRRANERQPGPNNTLNSTPNNNPGANPGNETEEGTPV